MIADARKALALVDRGNRYAFFALLPLAVCSALIEALSAAAVFGLLRIVSDAHQASQLPIAASIFARLPRQDDTTVILAFTVLVLALYLVRNVVLAVSAFLEAKVVYGSILDMSIRLMKAYLDAPYAFFLQRNSASFIQRVRNATDVVGTDILAGLVHLTTEVLVVVAFLILLALTAPMVTLLAAAALTIFLLSPVSTTTKLFRRWGADQERLEKTLLQEMQQSLGAVKEIRMAGAEAFFLDRFRASRAAFARLEHRRAFLSDALRFAVETTFVATLLVVVVVMTLRGDQGQRAVSLLGLYAYAGFRLVPSANRITRTINVIRGARPAIQDLENDLAAIDQRPESRRPATERDLHVQQAIRLDGVSYVYDGSDVRALDHVDFDIRHGESIGIVGPTGSGKSTLVAVLLGLLEPTVGRVLVDGVDIRSATRQWRKCVGYVPQEFYLLDDTVRANIAFGIAGEVDPESLARAIRLAQLEDVIAALPQGLETRLGERGARLSGGQKQRIAIARALYHDPQILVFDEATAALDLQTELEITRAVAALSGSKTVIVIAHRLSTVRGCDRLVMLRQGRITAVGSFDELMVLDAEFRASATVV
jgi:ATP-binding cassette subfamily C protein